MHIQKQERKFSKKSGRIITICIVLGVLFMAFVGVQVTPTYAAGGVDPNTKTADSLSTGTPDNCFFFDNVTSKLYGTAPQNLIDVPGVGTLEIDDTVYANSCSKAFASNIIMSGLIYVHWYSLYTATGSAPNITVTLNSSVVNNGINASWSAGGGINAGVTGSTDAKPAATVGADVHLDFSVSPDNTTINTSSGTITNQSSATFSYQNLAATATSGGGQNVKQTDNLNIQLNNTSIFNDPISIVVPYT